MDSRRGWLVCLPLTQGQEGPKMYLGRRGPQKHLGLELNEVIESADAGDQRFQFSPMGDTGPVGRGFFLPKLILGGPRSHTQGPLLAH